VLCAVIGSGTARAQSPGQLWATGTVRWLPTDRWSFLVTAEPRDQLIVPDDQPTYLSFDTTPRVLYVVAPWIDVLGEIDFQVKHQSNDVDTNSVTPRFGVQLHILSRILNGGGVGRGADREPQPGRRVNFRTLLRLEDQREEDTGESTTTSSWQFRDRFSVAYPLNRPKTTSNGAVYLTTDSEAFVPLDGGGINQFRLRSGFGYRHSFPWRVEALYIWRRDRSDAGVWTTKYNALDFRVFFQF
jgi:Protein of unknown function (DUF2490)